MWKIHGVDLTNIHSIVSLSITILPMIDLGKPLVSVLLPCYNAAATLSEAIESLQRQTLENFEIVAVDDGSTDETLALLEAFAKRDNRVHVFAQPHGGIINALNAGLGFCQAEFMWNGLLTGKKLRHRSQSLHDPAHLIYGLITQVIIYCRSSVELSSPFIFFVQQPDKLLYKEVNSK